MFPSPSTGAAENAYSATPPSHRTRIELENGYNRGIDMLPSATPAASSYSTTASTWPGVGSLAYTLRRRRPASSSGRGRGS